MGNNILRRKKHQKIRARREARAREMRSKKAARKAIRYLLLLEQIKSNLPVGSKLSKEKLSPSIHRRLNFPDFQQIKAPSHFSFLNNTVDTLHFIKKIEGCLQRNQKTFIVLEEVKTIDYTAIIVFLSIMIRFKKRGVPFNGNFPSDNVSRQIFDESNFLSHLYDLPIKRLEKFVGHNSSIYTETSKIVSNELAKRVISEASSTIWGEPKRCQGVYGNLVELMVNTHNHAEIGQKGTRNWFLVVTHLNEEKRVIFAFVDYGVGVINSLANKKPGEKYFGVVEKIKQLLGLESFSNADLMRQIFVEQERTSSTQLSHRGYGLPSLYQSFVDHDISNLHYITNDVYIRAPDNNFKVLSANFQGTFVYWELDNSCNVLDIARLQL